MGASFAADPSNENESPRQPRATPARPSTGDKLAALKARRSAARPASGRRAADDATTAPGTEPATAAVRGGPPSLLAPDPETFRFRNLDEASPNALAMSNEWREFDPRGSFGRPPAASNETPPRADDDDDGIRSPNLKYARTSTA